MLTAEKAKGLKGNAQKQSRIIRSLQKSKNISSVLAGQMHWVCQECSDLLYQSYVSENASH